MKLLFDDLVRPGGENRWRPARWQRLVTRPKPHQSTLRTSSGSLVHYHNGRVFWLVGLWDERTVEECDDK